MSQVSWDAFEKGIDEKHQLVAERLNAAMETGHTAAARELLDEYSKEYPTKAEALRLSCVRKYGTGL
jgi:hypothetical protein